MAPAGAKKPEDKGTAEVVADLWQLVRNYAKQETVDPLKSIGRFLLWGGLGALSLAIGLGLSILAVVRALQEESGSRLSGSLDWVPFLGALLLAIVAAALAARAITKPNRDGARS